MTKSNGEILYPIFLQCVEYSLDKFWSKIFEDLAYGNTPYGVYFNRDCLCCGKGKHGESTNITDIKDSLNLYNNVYNMLNTSLGMMSPDERLKKQQEFMDMEEDNKSQLNKWSDIKKKNIKDLLIELYSIKMKQLHNLSVKQTRYLISFICMALLFKSITQNHIEMQNGRISNIIGIEFSDKHIEFALELYSSDIDDSSSTTPLNIRTSMIDNWDKYVITLSKKNDFFDDFDRKSQVL
jgi:hypothetical protein